MSNISNALRVSFSEAALFLVQTITEMVGIPVDLGVGGLAGRSAKSNICNFYTIKFHISEHKYPVHPCQAQDGQDFAQRFTWDNAADRLEKIISV